MDCGSAHLALVVIEITDLWQVVACLAATARPHGHRRYSLSVRSQGVEGHGKKETETEQRKTKTKRESLLVSWYHF